ncbi:thiamine transporter 2-like isoform X2 [Daktulosphaira vitifoliae]|uniref:thiamine transporter 2-like isoform X2 n=1 Tax=Daktulosphaira vitifoliae TaxID=58002 RepID=UPI0021A9D953|nr:thiamine transporter 2-like isoform X2 [Daktulosphaira vitifoliae]
MEEWIKITLYLCMFAFFRDFRPVDSFYTAYLSSPAVNFTSEQISEDIYPVNAYSCTSVTIIIFLITDFFRYKPIVVLDALCSMLIYIMVMKPITLLKVQIAMGLTGLSSATELAYSSYIYAKIRNRALYQKMTGFIRGSYLMGKCLSAAVSQILVSYSEKKYDLLVYLSLAGSTSAFIFSFLLPRVKASIYFYPEVPSSNRKQCNYKTLENLSLKDSCEYFNTPETATSIRVVLQQLYSELKDTFYNPYLLKYSIWTGIAGGVYFQVMTYKDVFYNDLNKSDPVNNKLYNGAVDSLAFITGAFSTYCLGFLNLQWKRISNLYFFIGCMFCCIVLSLTYLTTSLNLIYLMYILYTIIYQSMFTIARSETAKYLQHDSFAFIIGLNYFFELCMSSLFTFVIVQGSIFVLPTNTQTRGPTVILQIPLVVQGYVGRNK